MLCNWVVFVFVYTWKTSTLGSLFQKAIEYLRGEEVRAQITRYPETTDHVVDLSGFLWTLSMFPAGAVLSK